ncbi:putative secreted protein with PEP-CTERM sorting signal [Pseudoduganella flava]|uniref:Putative secreted protein with PEP-CTERM sorting signal n=1 Tax=Pseudoduganella flava TaxID=871742 RepID=A0A562PCT5_9BURK|nr:PEP-CTERM sorting domain-containing protein [Pseudoduganella flava]QGZ40107.1 hypothetical protein GO485_14245 [Pseudoduganella flava]TWI42143.1 putative secreted protein with PEP-CTERM sorting signal [Pseudoduganella flava]
MLKKKIAAVVVAYAWSIASAFAEDFHVEYVGFYDAYAHAFLPTARLDLEFRAEDYNQDGTYSLDELTWFAMGRIYAEGGGCMYYSCVDQFSYKPGTLPIYSARYHMSDERFQYNSAVKSGEYYTDDNYYVWRDEEHLRWEWTSATRTWINGVPVVPEPAAYAMWGLGLAGMLAMGRWRGRKT